MTLVATEVPDFNRAFLEARPGDHPTAPWVQLAGDAPVFPVPQAAEFRASEEMVYRLRTAAAGPVVKIVTRRAEGVEVLT